MSSETGQIHELLPKAAAAIKAVGKTGENTQQNYKFRAVDDVVGAANPALSTLGISLTREVVSMDRGEAVKTSRGGQMRVTVLHCRFTFTAPDGSSITTDAIGEGMDSGDKGANKAMSAALKYALCHALLIPTEDRSDPEWDNADVGKDVAERKAIEQAKAALSRAFMSAWRAAGSEGKPKEIARAIIQHRYGVDELSTAAEIEDTQQAIESGEYDLATAERVPEPTEPENDNPQGDLL